MKINKRVICLSLVLLILSCNNVVDNHIDTEDILIQNNSTWSFDDSLGIFIENFYNTNDELIGTNIYNEDTSKVQRQIYNDLGELDSLIVYYPSGKIKEKRDYQMVYGYENPSLNTWIHYLESGEVDVSNSAYCEVLNTQNEYRKGSEEKLKVKLIGTEGSINVENGGVRVVFNSFDRHFKHDPKRSSFYYANSLDNSVELPLTTDVLGENIFRFIIEEYEVGPDSVIATRPIFVSYEYTVVEG